MNDLKSIIRNVPDFPQKGIGFKDITPLLKDGAAFRQAVDALCEPFRDQPIDAVVGIESRGFIFGAAMAVKLGCGFIPIRKPGKLPGATIRETYSLEYGTDSIEIHEDAMKSGDLVVLADDLLATGGTAAAALRLIRKLNTRIAGAAFLIELDFLNGRQHLGDVPIHVLVHFDAE